MKYLFVYLFASTRSCALQFVYKIDTARDIDMIWVHVSCYIYIMHFWKHSRRKTVDYLFGRSNHDQ